MDGEIQQVVREAASSNWALIWTAIAALGAFGSAVGSFMTAYSSSRTSIRILVETLHHDMMRSLQKWRAEIYTGKQRHLGELSIEQLDEAKRLLYVQVRIADLKTGIRDIRKGDPYLGIGSTPFDRYIIASRIEIFKGYTKSRKVRAALDRSVERFEEDKKVLPAGPDGTPDFNQLRI